MLQRGPYQPLFHRAASHTGWNISKSPPALRMSGTPNSFSSTSNAFHPRNSNSFRRPCSSTSKACASGSAAACNLTTTPGPGSFCLNISAEGSSCRLVARLPGAKILGASTSLRALFSHVSLASPVLSEIISSRCEDFIFSSICPDRICSASSPATPNITNTSPNFSMWWWGAREKSTPQPWCKLEY